MWLEYFEQYLDRVFPRFLSEKLWNYKDDLCMVGAEDLYCATGSESWREPVRRNASFLMDDAGRVANWVPGEHNIDKVSFGKSMRILRDVTGEARWAEGVERAYRILADYPAPLPGTSGTRTSIRIRSGWTACTWGCPSTPPAWQKTARTTGTTFWTSLPPPTNCCGMSSWVCTVTPTTAPGRWSGRTRSPGRARWCGSVPRAGSSWHWRTPTRSQRTALPVLGSCALC